MYLLEQFGDYKGMHLKVLEMYFLSTLTFNMHVISANSGIRCCKVLWSYCMHSMVQIPRADVGDSDCLSDAMSLSHIHKDIMIVTI